MAPSKTGDGPAYDFIISRNTRDDRYRVWRLDLDAAELLTAVPVSSEARFGRTHTHLGRALLVWLLTFWMMLSVTLQALLWALVYLFDAELTVLPDLQTAFYFSMVTFTTLGYGDVVLTGAWRTLASIQAANGVIIFGWTTALIFYFIQVIYRRD